VLPGQPTVILDVAHNPNAARSLALNLAAMPKAPATIAVFGMLKDKDIAGVINAVKAHVTRWHIASPGGERGASSAELSTALAAAGAHSNVEAYPDIAHAWFAAREAAGKNDKIVVFGSFLTVAAVLRELRRTPALPAPLT